MTIKVRFFASLRERLGYGETELPFQANLTALDVWKLSSQDQPLNSHILVAVNQEYVCFEQGIQDGDEVAFFPPVTGG